MGRFNVLAIRTATDAGAMAEALRRAVAEIDKDQPVAGAAMVLVAVVVGSGLFPARRAMRVDPVVALREE